MVVHDWWEGSVRVVDYTADFEGAGLAAQSAVFVFLGEVAHEAVQGHEIGFPATVDRAGEIYEASVRGPFPQRSPGWVMGCWSAMAFAPCLYIFDGVFLLAADGAAVY